MKNTTILISDQNPDSAEYYRSILPLYEKQADSPEICCNVKMFPDVFRLKDYFCAQYREGRRIPLSIFHVNNDFTLKCRAAEHLMNTDPGTMILLIAEKNNLTGPERRELKPGIYFIEKTKQKQAVSSMIHTLLRNWKAREHQYVSSENLPGNIRTHSGTGMIFDEKSVNERMGSNRELIRMMLTTYIRNIPKQIAQLEEELRTQNNEAVWKAGHTLKGSAATAGAAGMQEIALQIEQTGKAGNMDESRQLLHQFKVAFENFRKFVSEQGFI